MLIAVLSLFVGALVAPLVYRLAGRTAAWWLALVPAAVAMGLATSLPEIAAGRTLTESIPWVGGLGVALSFRLDGLSLLFALLITGIGSLVTLYAGAYLHSGHARFLASLLAFTGSMLGLVLADNLVLLFVFWELTTVTSFLLVGHDHERPAARRAALQALLVTGLGGLALLAGLLLLGAAVGSLEMGAVLAADGLAEHPAYGWILALVLLGCFTKSAQVPFHFWLPGAMEAPTPASAFLHSSTMVKAGVYLLARLHPSLSGTEAWTLALSITGGVTLLLAAWMAWQQTDLKKLLAYSTVAVLGTLTLLLGLGSGPALKAVAVLILAHALYKAALFLVTGIVDHETGTRDLASLGGLAPSMPVTAGVAAVAALSMAGLPPLAGFLGKEVVLDAVLKHEAPGIGLLLSTAAVAMAAALTVAAALLAGVRPFFGRSGRAGGDDAVASAHDPTPELWLPPALLAAGGIAAGLAAPWVGRTLVAPAAGSIAGTEVPVKLALWHGPTPAFLLGLTLLALGTGLYFAWERLHPAGVPAARGTAALFEKAYDRTLAAVFAAAGRCDRWLQDAPLSRHVAIVVGVAVVAVGGTLGRAAWIAAGGGGEFPAFGPQAPAGLVEAALAGVILAASAVAVASRSRFAAVAALGAVGFAVALIFFHYGAPDLALTLLVVETLTVVLVALAFRRLPRFGSLSSPGRRRRDGVLALSAGLLMALLVLVAVEVELPAEASRYYAEASVPEGYGRNVVNVILVDFRALDTLGEIAVLGIAALGAFALLKLRPERRGGGSGGGPGGTAAAGSSPVGRPPVWEDKP